MYFCYNSNLCICKCTLKIFWLAISWRLLVSSFYLNLSQCEARQIISSTLLKLNEFWFIFSVKLASKTSPIVVNQLKLIFKMKFLTKLAHVFWNYILSRFRGVEHGYWNFGRLWKYVEIAHLLLYTVTFPMSLSYFYKYTSFFYAEYKDLIKKKQEFPKNTTEVKETVSFRCLLFTTFKNYFTFVLAV